MLRRTQFVLFIVFGFLWMSSGCAGTVKAVKTDVENAVVRDEDHKGAKDEQYEVVVCGAESANDSADGCTRRGQGNRIVLKGDILAPSKVYQNGVVIVDSLSGKILYSGCDQEQLHDSEEIIIECTNSVISPGMINAHEHITYSNGAPAVWGEERYEHRNDWRKGIHEHTPISGPSTTHIEVVELRQMMGGATSVFGSGKANGLLRNLDEEDVGGVKSIYQTFPLGDAQANDYPEDVCTFSYHESVTKYDESCPYGPHVGEGINEAAHNELVCLSGQNGGVDIFKPNLAVIHGVAASPDLIEKMSSHNVKMVWSPRTNISLYGDTAPVTVYDRLGVTIGLGTDWLYSGSANMLRELQCVDSLNQNYYNHYFSDYEIWRMPTMGSALALGVSHVLGKIDKNYFADIVIYKKRGEGSPYRSVIDAENKDVQLVMVNGKLIYGDENLILEGETVNVCGVMKKYDAVATGSKSLQEISQNAGYPLFFCETPKDEPSCIPQRTREEDTVRYLTSRYSGISDGDRDGDGVSDEQDNCKEIFNPVRPQDKSRVQSDFDGDGIGDICDIYPLCRDNDTSCKVYTKDHDGDGIDDYFDNCPEDSNRDQSDIDGDNRGDVCDKCDDRYDRDGDGISDDCDKCPEDGLNEDGHGCRLEVVSLKSIRQSVADGSFEPRRVKVTGVVTGIGRRGFFIQQEGAGLYIFETAENITLPGDQEIAEGLELTIIGSLVTYYGFVEVKDILSVSVNGKKDRIKPLKADAQKIIQDSDDKSSRNMMDSTLVMAEHLTVKSFEKSKKNNYAVALDKSGHEVYIDDFMIGEQALFNALEEGKRYRVTGMIVYDYGMSKLAPRSIEDIVKE